MEKDVIEAKVLAVFRDIFDIEGVELSIDSRMQDIEDWDSIGHIRLMLALEEELRVPILDEKAAELTSVELIVRYLLDALAE